MVTMYGTVDQAIDKAAELGRWHGQAAGAYVVDGNTPTATLARLLDGIDTGDPEIIDALPASPLSGEWADGYTVRDLIRDAGLDEDDEDIETVLDELATVYEDAWSAAMVGEVERAARAFLPDDDDQDDRAA